MIPLYVIRQGKNATFMLEGEHNCSLCQKIIEETNAMIVTVFSGKPSESTFYISHVKCGKKKSQNIIGNVEVKLTLINMDIPKNAELVPLRPPRLHSSSDLSTWEAATSFGDKKMKSDTSTGYQINDKTVYAGRESWEGASIGSPDLKLLEEKDKELSEEEGIKLIEDLKKKKVGV